MKRKALTFAALLSVLVFRWSVGHLRLMAYNVTRSRATVQRYDARLGVLLQVHQRRVRACQHLGGHRGHGGEGRLRQRAGRTLQFLLHNDRGR